MSYKFADSFRRGSGWNMYRVSCQNKFVKLVHLVGFIIKKFVKMQGHMNVKYIKNCLPLMYQPGESNGKLPLITCPGCSVSEPYQSPD